MAAKYPQEIQVLKSKSLDTVEITVRKTFNSDTETWREEGPAN